MLQHDAVEFSDLHSLMVPGLCKSCWLRRLMYLLSGLLKLGLVVPAVVLLSRGFYPKLTVIVSSVNCAVFVISGFLDILVFASTPEAVAYRPAELIVHPSWFSTPFSYRHRLAVVLNRAILLFSGSIVTLAASPPADDWRLLDSRETIRMAVGLYGLLLLGSATPVLTQFLWCSWTFRFWGLCACLRLAVGILILGIANRCVTQSRFLRGGHDPDYNILPLPLKEQALLLFDTLIYNAYFASISAHTGFIFAMIAGWTRSKKWISWNMNYIAPVTLLLGATFVSSSLLKLIKRMFCEYELIFAQTPGYPKHSAFANHHCAAIRFNPQLNGQHWLTALLILLDCWQLTLAALMYFRREWQPMEWSAAERLLLRSIKNERVTDTSPDCQLEGFVTTLTQRKSMREASLS